MLFYYIWPRSVLLNPRFDSDKGLAKPGSKKFCYSGLYELFLLQGGRLVSIHKTEENTFVKQLFEDSLSVGGWIGITDRNVEGI